MSEHFTAEQVRAGRAMLRITQGELADRAGLPFKAIARIEGRQGSLATFPFGTVEMLRTALETSGVVFGPGSSVRMREAS